MKRTLVLFLIYFFLISCKKEDKVYFENGNIKYLNVLDEDILNFKRFDEEGNLLFVGRFKNNQLIDTLFAYGQKDDFMIKIDSSDKDYFYGKYVSKYSTGQDAKVSLLRFNKGLDIDSIISSSLLFGKEVVYLPNGKKAKEAYYKIEGNTSQKIFEKNYDTLK